MLLVKDVCTFSLRLEDLTIIRIQTLPRSKMVVGEYQDLGEGRSVPCGFRRVADDLIPEALRLQN